MQETPKPKLPKKLPFDSIMDWSFIIMLIVFGLSFIDHRFGILGLLCLAVPIVLALLGYGRAHCTHLCPRGSFLGKVVKFISLKKKLPKFFRDENVRFGLIVFFVMCMLGNVLRYFPDWVRMANGMFQIMVASLFIGIVFGVIFHPRSWCAFCPVGALTGEIQKAQLKQQAKKVKPVQE